MDLRHGDVLDDRYTLIDEIGRGSMSTVYRARQHAMGRDVAVKVLRTGAGSRERFLREARAHSRLGSPHTVSVLDFGVADEPYLVMELLEGESLATRLARASRLAPADAASAARQILASLAEAHAHGIVHRDLKPENLFFARDAFGVETVKVLDFGIAKVLRRSEPELCAPETHVGTILGTPRYMSPEQARGAAVDGRSDLYALGVVLYEMLAGEPPFVDRDTVVVLAHHVGTTPRAVRELAPEVPEWLDAFVARLLAKDSADRPATAEDAARMLEPAPAPAPPRRVFTALRAFGVLAIVALACCFATLAALARTAPAARAAPPRMLAPHASDSALTPADLPDAIEPATKPPSRRARRKH